MALVSAISVLPHAAHSTRRPLTKFVLPGPLQLICRGQRKKIMNVEPMF
jgi:hypothetical protein